MADNNTNELDALMISELPTQATANETDLFEVAIVDANSASGYASKKETAAAIADAIVGEYQYPLRITGTTAKTIAGAINELENLKANTSSLATVATSGAYSDLSGKPTIDTALDTTSTNAVENRAVAGAINGIRSDITVDGSASGDIATFVDGSANPLKGLEISIEAVQSGSGDPSPTNVRPITGWTECNIVVENTNLWDEQWVVGTIDNTGTYIPSGSRVVSKNYIRVPENTSLYMGSNAAWCYFYKEKSVSSYYTYANVQNGVVNVPSGVKYMKFYTTSTYGTTYNNDISVNYPSTDTNYHAHTETTTNIDWSSVTP